MNANQSQAEKTVKHIRHYYFLIAIGVNQKKGAAFRDNPESRSPF